MADASLYTQCAADSCASSVTAYWSYNVFMSAALFGSACDYSESFALGNNIKDRSANYPSVVYALRHVGHLRVCFVIR